MTKQIHKVSRRSFLAGCALSPLTVAAGAREAPDSEDAYKKALVVSDISHPGLESLKQAGFAGVETREADAAPEKAAEIRKIAEEMGIKIHSVMRGWVNLDSQKKSEVEASLEKVKNSLRAAEAYGADAVLVVPCRVGGMDIPAPWEFDIEFNPDTLHVKRVVKGDNEPYREYIKAQNHATDATREAIKQLIPAAEKHGVVICLENVWNNLWVTPQLFAAYVRSFKSPWVQAYFDIGNHVKYDKPQNYVRTLDGLVERVHVKDFRLKSDGHGGEFVPICNGSVDFPAVIDTLREAGYEGWMTIEGKRGLDLSQLSRRLDAILAGKSGSSY
mgnify:CR=1 FL=1